MKEKEQNSRSTYRILSLLLFVLLIFAVVLWVYEDRSNEMLEQKNILIERLTKTMKKNNSLEFETDSLNDLLLEQQDELFLLLDTLAELNFVSTNKITPAILTPIVTNGRISRIVITESGRGYKVAPSFKINGAGTDAEFDISINNLGQIISVVL